MPVYKDTAPNRKLGRVGKAYGKSAKAEAAKKVAVKKAPVTKRADYVPGVKGQYGEKIAPIKVKIQLRPKPNQKISGFKAPSNPFASLMKKPVPAPRRKAVAGARTTTSTMGGPVARPRPASSLKKAVAPAKVKKARKTFMNSTTPAEFDRMKKDFPIGIQVLRLNYRVATVAQRKKIGWYEGTTGELRDSTIPDGWKVSAHTATGITIKKNDMKLNIPWKRADNWTYHSY